MTLPVLIMIAALAGGSGEHQIEALASHLATHPAATARDVYKFLHQGSFGPGHVIHDRESASRYLSDEIEALDVSQVIEMPCEPLGGDPPMVRVHLRPFVRGGYDRADLLSALIASAGFSEGNAGAMRRALDAAAEWLRGNRHGSMADELDRLRAENEPHGFPALHHSEAYRGAYQPAYRVVLERYAREHDWCEAVARP